MTYRELSVAEYMQWERTLVRIGCDSIKNAIFCFRAAYFGRVGTISIAIRDACDRRGRFNLGHRFDSVAARYHKKCARLCATASRQPI